jgi:hypothetical protein
MRAIVPKNRHKRDETVHYGQNCHPTGHNLKQGVVDIEQIDDKARKEDEQRKMYHGQQCFDHPENVKFLDTSSQRTHEYAPACVDCILLAE